MPEKLRTSSEDKLTQENFDALLSALHADRDQAGIRYEGLRERLIFFFSRRQFTFVDVLADAVLNRIAQQIQTGERVEKIEAYAYGIARHVAQEELRRNYRAAEAENTYVGNILPPPNTSSDDELLEAAMEECLKMREPAEREFLLAYYAGRGQDLIERRRALAAAMDLSVSALRKRVFRLREALESCLEARLSGGSGSRAHGR